MKVILLCGGAGTRFEDVYPKPLNTSRYNTIFSYPTQYKDYSTVRPIQHIKNLVHLLKSKGHEIVINTARKMVSCNDNVDEAGIPYDELYFGKPYGDIYIDDRAFNTFDKNLSEQIGFYEGSVSIQDYQANRYNKVKRINKTRIMKEGSSLFGEIWFYDHIQQSNIHKYFPMLISRENVNRILLEYIDGTLLSKIYNEGLLQDFLLIKLLDVVQEIHSTQLDDGIQIDQQIIIEENINDIIKLSGYLIYNTFHVYPENFDIKKNIIPLYVFNSFGFTKTRTLSLNVTKIIGDKIKSPFQQTLGFIRWNSAHRERISIMEKYRPFFADLHYSMPGYTSQLTYIADGWDRGATIYKVLGDTIQIILQNYSAIEGILYFHFDDFIDSGNVFYDVGSFHEVAVRTMINIIDLTYRSTPFHTVITRLTDCWGDCCTNGASPDDIKRKRCGHRIDLTNDALRNTLIDILDSQKIFLNRTILRKLEK
ncbi:hypothetical protein I4U23_011392 [Adineta vaga]|nr:hypothetical protein I4U23_011392 [Adineta vaga]